MKQYTVIFVIHKSTQKKNVGDRSPTITGEERTMTGTIAKSIDRKLSPKMTEKIEYLSKDWVENIVKAMKSNRDINSNSIHSLWRTVVANGMFHGKLSDVYSILVVGGRQSTLYVALLIDLNYFACFSVKQDGSVSIYGKEKRLVTGSKEIAMAFKSIFTDALNGIYPYIKTRDVSKHIKDFVQ